jgi:ABC-type multidrug transport system ATPase subunit
VNGVTPDVGDKPPVLTVDGIKQAFGPVAVLDGVSFDCRAGSVSALIGPNGSGKTTLLRIIAGVLDPTVGIVKSPEVSRPVGYLPQNPDFRPTFTVRETVEFYTDLLDTPSHPGETVDRVGLGGVADRRVDALSGGMKRLLGVALAIVGDPPIVLLDEPTGDLDPRMTDHIFETVDTLAADGRTVLLATHDLAGAARADEVLVLDRGEIALRGFPATITDETGTDSLGEAFLSIVGTELSVRKGQEGQS